MMEDEDDAASGEDARRAKATVFAAAAALTRSGSTGSSGGGSRSGSGSSTPPSPRSPMHHPAFDPMMMAPPASSLLLGDLSGLSAVASAGGAARIKRTSTGGCPDTSMIVSAEYCILILPHDAIPSVWLLLYIQSHDLFIKTYLPILYLTIKFLLMLRLMTFPAMLSMLGSAWGSVLPAWLRC